MASELPCDGEGVCMVCKNKAEGTINCTTCTTPWHATCLRTPPKTLADEANWVCPDCSGLAASAPVCVGGGELVEKIRAIESDSTLTEAEKAQKRQALLSGGNGEASGVGKKGNSADGALGILDDKFNCSICMLLLDRPVSTPCGHNFCLKCFQKWVGQQGKKTCAMCREPIPSKMAAEPRINSAIVMAIRMAKHSQSNSSDSAPKVYHVIHNQDRPDKAFTTERAKKSGIANACSGKIFVTIPSDHFGPITAEYDPTRNQGVLVGETWRDRMECRQWGAHFSHVAGINGQSNHGAQSVALSGGYEDDEDHGDWFLYTGSGGRDLSGNKRTNKFQSFDQKFTKSNEALRVSCRHGYPVRVVRSHKEKRSSYAPPEGVRYDGVYRIEKCWRKVGVQGFKVCRYLFVRCDNEPAPWTSDDRGDRPRSLPPVEELNNATDVFERKGSPSWDYDEEQGRWVWKKPPPESCKTTGDQDGKDNESKKRKRKNGKGSVKERLLKEFSCLMCRKVMVQPLTTPCAHNFCKTCLEGKFAGQSFVKQRTCGGRRTLRAQKNVMKCPSCQNDITEFLQNPQVNRELQDVIESLQTKMKEEAEENKNPYGEGDGDDNEDEGTDIDEGEDSKDSEETSNDKENCNVNAGPDLVEMGEDASKDSLKQSEAARPTRNSKRMKLSEEAGALASDSDKS